MEASLRESSSPIESERKGPWGSPLALALFRRRRQAGSGQALAQGHMESALPAAGTFLRRQGDERTPRKEQRGKGREHSREGPGDQ